MGPLLTTKLHVPRRRRGLVARPRLEERLSRGAEGPLTLVAAPAGFGKTTLLTDWLTGWVAASETRPAAWLSLDERDNDPVVFWSYLVAALQPPANGGLDGALTVLRERHTPVDEVLGTLINELDAVPDDVVLVLDDYHVISAREVHEGLAFLLEHLPPQVHLVIATRADPALPLARLRARGELVEVRADDLRFTAGEAAAYLTGAMGLALSAEQVTALETRTEGWIAALQLAALSMQGRHDLSGFVDGFTGDDRYVVDYLVEEVLQRQSDDVRAFLLQTAVLSRLNGSLCDAVVGHDGGRTVLEAIDRANLFLVPLDDHRHWYRYHHLFADVLRARLLAEEPERVPELHLRASSWHAQHGEASEAIRHALAGGDAERAADLVELAMPAARRNREETSLRQWLRQLPEAVLRDRPALAAGYAGAMLVHGELDGVEEHLRDAERWLDAAESRDGAGAGRAEARAVRSQIAVYRAAQARLVGDVAGTITHARSVLDLAADDDHLARAAAAGLLGLAQWTEGDLEAAHRWWSQSQAGLERAGHHSDSLGVAIALADIRVAQGRLRDARTTYTRGLDASAARGPSVLRGTADLHVGLSELFRERDDLQAARRHLVASAELGERAGLPQNRYRSRVATARVLQAEGDLDGAVDQLDEAERLYVGDMFPDVRPVAAARARVWLAQGRVGAALSWARERGLSAEDDLSYLREFEHVTLARALLRQHAETGDRTCLTQAVGLLERLLPAAERGGRTGTVLEVLVLLAVAEQDGDDPAGAVRLLDRALTLAEPEGYARVFLDEGPSLTPLLKAAAKQPAARAPAQRLLAARAGAGGGIPAQQGLVEPLSARELDVLRLLGTDLDGPSVARELFVSVNTVRTHTRNLYAKLGVNSRRAAVRRADELDLLPRAPLR